MKDKLGSKIMKNVYCINIKKIKPLNIRQQRTQKKQKTQKSAL